MCFPSWFKALGLAGLLFLGGWVFTACNKPAAPPRFGPAEVSVLTLGTEKVVLTTELPGRIAPFLVAEIRPQVNGLLLKRLFQEGANVKEGELLYQIDPTPYQAAYDQAKAALGLTESEIALAEANLPAIRLRAERLKGLAEIRAVGQQDYDDAAAALRQAEANIKVRKTAVDVNKAAMETARIQLSYTPIKAPISGRIGKSNITVGALVSAYQPNPLAVIQQLDPIYVDVTQASADLLRLKKSLESGKLKRSGESHKVRLLLEDGSGYPLPGTLQFRDVTVDPTAGTVTLRLVFPNPDAVLLPGMFVRAIVEEGVSEEALLAPQQGVTRDNKGNAIAWVVNASDIVEQRALVVNRALGDKWLVEKGLAPGDRLIMEGTLKTRPGSPVKAVPFSERADQRPAGAENPASGGKK